MIGQHVGHLPKGGQALPAELIHPSCQVAHGGAFVLVIPEMLQRFLEQIGLHDPPIEFEQLIEQRSSRSPD